MIVIKATKLVGVDIDDTLVVWKGDKYYPHEAHIECVKRFHARGHTLVAWSAGGEEWAARVVRELDLEQYFVLAMSKFDWFLDDKKAEEFLPEAHRVYLGIDK